MHNHKDEFMADNYQIGGDHYHRLPVQPWTLMEAILSEEEFIGFLKGSAIKYAMRAGLKPESDDAEKLKHYLHKLEEYVHGR